MMGRRKYPRLEKYGGLMLVSLGLVLLCFIQLLKAGANPRQWDFLLLSGTAAFIFGIWRVQEIPRKLEESLTRLMDRGSLLTTGKQLTGFQKSLEERSQVWSKSIGLVTGTAMLIAFLVAFSGLERIVLTLLEVAGAYIAGRYLGPMAFYGTLKWRLEKAGMRLKVKPGHPDGVNGLKPLGDFYFSQAMVAAIPAVFLFVWSLAIWFIPFFANRYPHWKGPYLGLLAVAIVLEVLVFILPLWLFHQEMKEQKKALLPEADRLSRQIAEIQIQLTVVKTGQECELLKERLFHINQRYRQIEYMFTWPVDIKTGLDFLLRNVMLSLPVVIDTSINLKEIFNPANA